MSQDKYVAICGCGFRSSNLEEARAHADAKGHKIDIVGQITPNPKFEKMSIPKAGIRKDDSGKPQFTNVSVKPAKYAHTKEEMMQADAQQRADQMLANIRAKLNPKVVQ